MSGIRLGLDRQAWGTRARGAGGPAYRRAKREWQCRRCGADWVCYVEANGQVMRWNWQTGATTTISTS